MWYLSSRPSRLSVSCSNVLSLTCLLMVYPCPVSRRKSCIKHASTISNILVRRLLKRFGPLASV
ncbi:hypothetical protein PF003_g8201 [Phytophthora fragariae]|nr:hypothetical protein PF003_g8201 [Phytophthora fragariae]